MGLLEYGGAPLVRSAAAPPGGEQLEVFADNERAIHLYEKLGFEKEGLLCMTTVRSGRYVDDCKMARIRIPGEALT